MNITYDIIEIRENNFKQKFDSIFGKNSHPIADYNTWKQFELRNLRKQFREVSIAFLYDDICNLYDSINSLKKEILKKHT